MEYKEKDGRRKKRSGRGGVVEELVHGECVRLRSRESENAERNADGFFPLRVLRMRRGSGRSQKASGSGRVIASGTGDGARDESVRNEEQLLDEASRSRCSGPGKHADAKVL